MLPLLVTYNGQNLGTPSSSNKENVKMEVTFVLGELIEHRTRRIVLANKFIKFPMNGKRKTKICPEES